MYRKIVDFFVFSSLYIAICAILIVWQTSRLLTGNAPSGRLQGFIFFATICSYNFHWYLTPRSASPSRRIQWAHRHKTIHLILSLAGAAGAAVYFFYLLPHFWAIGFSVFLTFLYSAPKLPQKVFQQLRHIAIGKTIFLASVWVYVTNVLPIIVADVPWQTSFTLFTAGRFFFTYAICIMFDYKDRDDDRAQGIRSLITMLDEKRIDWLFVSSLCLFFLCSIALSWYHYPAFYILLLLIPGFIAGAIYRESKRNFSDDLYHIVLDGLLMFSGLLMLIFRI